MNVLPLVLLSPVLVAVAWFDLRYLRIPNALVIAALVLFVLTSPLLGWAEIGTRLMVASLVFVIGASLFAFSLFGGGDVKMMAALMLFVPSSSYTLFAACFSVSMLAGIIAVMTLRQMSVLDHAVWASLGHRGAFPMGISIAGTGLVHPFVIHLAG